jgi:hypothetical protein
MGAERREAARRALAFERTPLAEQVDHASVCEGGSPVDPLLLFRDLSEHRPVLLEAASQDQLSHGRGQRGGAEAAPAMKEADGGEREGRAAGDRRRDAERRPR